MLKQSAEKPHDVAQEPSPALITTAAIATGALVANLYYAQPLVASIGPQIGTSADLAGSITMITQMGYGAGLFLLVSLADLVENRKLVLATVALTCVGLIGVALSTSALPFFAASFVIGISSTGAQVLLPFVAHLVPEERRGRVIGYVMSGLLAGIMLARPASLFIAASFGWRAVFWCSAVLMMGIGLALAKMMPVHKPHGGMHYGRILASMAGLLRDMPAIRWRAAYQALMFAAFNMFWTAVPIMLGQRFGLGEHAIGLFALAGAGGALAAPLAGRLADQKLGGVLTVGAMLSLGLGFYLTNWAMVFGSLAGMVVLAVIIDAAVQINQIVGQRIIFAVPSNIRGRVNAIYMTLMFAGGALGSLLGTLTYDHGGWEMTAIVGGLLGAAGLGLFAIEMIRKSRHG
ncbi:MAG TPA: MFS transporter [Dongiaceae bacterium]